MTTVPAVKSSRRTVAELQEAFKAIAKTLNLKPSILTDRCRELAIKERKVVATLTPSQWLRLGEKIAEVELTKAGQMVPCDRACDKGVIHTKNSGDLKCFRCDGKGKQSPSDVERNRRYDLAHPDKANRKFEREDPPKPTDDNRGNR